MQVKKNSQIFSLNTIYFEVCLINMIISNGSKQSVISSSLIQKRNLIYVKKNFLLDVDLIDITITNITFMIHDRDTHY